MNHRDSIQERKTRWDPRVFPANLAGFTPVLALLVTSYLAAAPTVAVVVARRVDVKADVVAKVTSALEAALAAEKLPSVLGAAEARRRLADQGVDPASTCDNDRMCLLGQLHLLKVDVLIAVDLGHVVDQYALRFTALDSALGAPLAERGALLKSRQLGSALPEETRAFARELAAVLAARTPSQQPVEAPPLFTSRPAVEQRSPRAPVIIAFAAGGAAWVFSFASLMAGLSMRAQLDGSVMAGSSTLTRAQADALAGNANGWLTGSLVSLLVGAAALALGAVLWFSG